MGVHREERNTVSALVWFEVRSDGCMAITVGTVSAGNGTDPQVGLIAGLIMARNLWAASLPRFRLQLPTSHRKLWALLVGRRITGLAAEAAFWAIFSLPWLMLAFVSGLGVSAKYLGDEAVSQVRESIENVINRPDSRSSSTVRASSAHEVFNETRADLGILGLVIALWAGSRAVMSYVQSIMLINGVRRAQLPPTPWAFVGPSMPWRLCCRFHCCRSCLSDQSSGMA